MKSTKIFFNDAAQTAFSPGGLSLAIRDDTQYATKSFKAALASHITTKNTVSRPDDQAFFSQGTLNMAAVDGAYGTWMRTTLAALSQSLDYTKHYNITDPDAQYLNVRFYDPDALTRQAVSKADALVRGSAKYDEKTPVLYVTLDDLMEKRESWSEIAFSRLFSLDGNQHFGYTARPGKKPLDEQIADLRDQAASLKQKHGENVPIILLEDNVRHAKMLNWVIDKLDDGGIFDHADLAGISTCFCCADQDERNKILHGNNVVPLVEVIDFRGQLVDVVTPRDFMFDGFVVELGGRTTRLPGIFMNTEKLFKIAPEKANSFRNAILDANSAFCRSIQRNFGVSPALSWFDGADAISYVTGRDTATSMLEVSRHSMLKRSRSDSPAP